MDSDEALQPVFDRTNAEMHPSRPAPAVGLVALLVLVGVFCLLVVLLGTVLVMAQTIPNGGVQVLIAALAGAGLYALLDYARQVRL